MRSRFSIRVTGHSAVHCPHLNRKSFYRADFIEVGSSRINFVAADVTGFAGRVCLNERIKVFYDISIRINNRTYPVIFHTVAGFQTVL